MNYSVTYKNLSKAINAAKMFELRNLVSASIIDGNFHTARIAQKELAKTAVEDFDTFKTLPRIEITNVSIKEFFIVGLKTLEYKIYKFFTGKSKEEKIFSKMSKKIK